MVGEGADRAYSEIKRQILVGELKLRERLDLEGLARALKLSITPVRYALTRLGAERLVAAQGPRGYYVAMWSERELRALYEWRGALSLIALENWRGGASAQLKSDEAYETVFSQLLDMIEQGANPELIRAGANASERLQAAWAVEPECLSDAGAELDALKGAIELGDAGVVGALIREMFARRAGEAGGVRKRAAMRALPNGG